MIRTILVCLLPTVLLLSVSSVEAQQHKIPRIGYFDRREARRASKNSERKRMSGKIFVWLLVTFLLTTFSFAQAQQPQKIPRLGYLSYGSVEIDKSLLAALQQGLRELGYLEGKNIVIEQRYAAGQSDKLPELVAAFVRVKADVIVVTGDPAAHAAKKATTAIPIVIVTSPDPVGTGLIASLAHPGGNVTGLSDFHGGVVTKRLNF